MNQQELDQALADLKAAVDLTTGAVRTTNDNLDIFSKSLSGKGIGSNLDKITKDSVKVSQNVGKSLDGLLTASNTFKTKVNEINKSLSSINFKGINQSAAAAAASMQNFSKAAKATAGGGKPTDFSRLTNQTDSLTKSFANLQRTIDKISGSSIKSNTSINAPSTPSSTNTPASTSATVDNKSIAEFQAGIASATKGFTELYAAMSDTSSSFGKYNKSLEGFGDTLSGVLKKLGPIGFILGVAVDGVVKLGSAWAKQTDNTLKATDELSKMGAAGSFTAEEVRKMGREAGLTSENLQVFTKAVGRVNTGLTSLGITAGEGVKEFAKITTVSSEQRQAFQRLGVSQEDLMAQQADYIKLQELSGKSLVGQAKEGDKLKKQSLDYAENLAVLSQLTGQSAAGLQKDQEAAMLEYEEIVQTRLEDDKIRKLKAEGKKDEADNLQKEQDARKAFITQVTQQVGQEAGLKVAKVARTGGFDSSTSSLAMLGFTPEQIKAGYQGKSAEEAKKGGAEFTQQFKEKQSEKIGQLGTALQYGGEAMGKQFGLDKQSLQRTGKNVERDEAAALEAAKKNVGKPSEGTTSAKTQEDPAQIARNALTETEIKARGAIDDLTASTNPLLQGFNKLTTATTALVGVVVAAGAALALKQGISGLKGILGAGAGAAGAGAAGAGAAGAGAGILKTGARVLGKVALPLAAVSAGYDAVKGYSNAEDTLGIKGRKATLGEKLSSAAGGAISGLTFGLISSETISKGIAKATGAGPDGKKAEEEIKSTEELTTTNSSLSDSLDKLRTSIEKLTTTILKTNGGLSGGGSSGGGTSGGGSSGGGTSGGGSFGGGGAVPPIKQDVKGNLESVSAALKKRGIDDPAYTKAVLANIMKESGGKVTNENLDYSKTGNDRIKSIFGAAKGMSDEQLNQAKANPQSFAEAMYGANSKIGQGMGNTEAGDGWKFRGRGYIQLTGKNNYAAASKAIWGDDRLVKDPDLVNSPEVAADVVAWFMERSKSKMQSTMGFGAGPMSQDQANLLATSQIAGGDVRKKGGYLGGEVLNKVTAYSAQMDPYVGTQTASAGTKTVPQGNGGGLFSGPDSGYLVKMHGNEVAVPMADMQGSKVKDLSELLGKTSSGNSDMSAKLDQLIAVMSNGLASSGNNSTGTLMSELSSKLDEMIDLLRSSNNTQEKHLSVVNA